MYSFQGRPSRLEPDETRSYSESYALHPQGTHVGLLTLAGGRTASRDRSRPCRPALYGCKQPTRTHALDETRSSRNGLQRWLGGGGEFLLAARMSLWGRPYESGLKEGGKGRKRLCPLPQRCHINQKPSLAVRTSPKGKETWSCHLAFTERSSFPSDIH